MNLKETLKVLCAPPGVAGAESAAAEAACELLAQYMPNAEADKFNMVTGSIIRDSSLPTLLLDAHIDEVGMVVTYIDDDGFIKAEKAGGLDRRVLPAAAVTIWGREAVRGVVCTLPPHVHKNEGAAVKEDEIYIDCGFIKDEAERLISLGDSITADAEFCELQNGRVTARALDNRAGAAAILYALELLKNKPCRYNIAVLFSSQEELGLRGAQIAAFNVAPDLAIAVDVSYGDYPAAKENTTWKLGGGTMLGVSPVLDRGLFEELKAVAGKKNIPFQVEVMGGRTGTNADAISITRSGVRTALLSVPLRNMHTPCELVDISDIEATGRLIAAFSEGI